MKSEMMRNEDMYNQRINCVFSVESGSNCVWHLLLRPSILPRKSKTTAYSLEWKWHVADFTADDHNRQVPKDLQPKERHSSRPQTREWFKWISRNQTDTQRQGKGHFDEHFVNCNTRTISWKWLNVGEMRQRIRVTIGQWRGGLQFTSNACRGGYQISTKINIAPFSMRFLRT